jgi:hypothetical protein
MSSLHRFKFVLLSFFSIFLLFVNLSWSSTIISINNTQWFINNKIINPHSSAEGLLMNVRMANAVFEDIGQYSAIYLHEFSPCTNTSMFITQIKEYVASGINAFTISLQGGYPGYEGAINSAFNPDGTLRLPYFDRVKDVILEADACGAVIILTCFYQRQHSHKLALTGKDAIRNAVRNVASWITSQGFTNVLLEISNEYDHPGYAKWNDGSWLRSIKGQVELIHLAKYTAPHLLVSTSGIGNGHYPKDLAEASDFILIHFNDTHLKDYNNRIQILKPYNKPIVCNEDDKIDKIGSIAAKISVIHGIGWGFMHSSKNQYVPFEFDGINDDLDVYNTISELTDSNASVSISFLESFYINYGHFFSNFFNRN